MHLFILSKTVTEGVEFPGEVFGDDDGVLVERVGHRFAEFIGVHGRLAEIYGDLLVHPRARSRGEAADFVGALSSDCRPAIFGDERIERREKVRETCLYIGDQSHVGWIVATERHGVHSKSNDARGRGKLRRVRHNSAADVARANEENHVGDALELGLKFLRGTQIESMLRGKALERVREYQTAGPDSGDRQMLCQ